MSVDKRKRPSYNAVNSIGILQGGVQFPTGGTAREPKGMTRCDSGADSIVWMKEERFAKRCFCIF